MELKEIAKKNINVPQLMKDIIKEIGKPALQNAVQKTKTSLDDMALELLFPIIEKELYEKIDELWEKL